MQEKEADLVDLTLDRIMIAFKEVRFLEIGVLGAGTIRGVYNRAKDIGCPIHGAGVDFEQYRPGPPIDPSYAFYAGDSMDVWRNIKETYNFLFVDGCHCVNHSMSDFLNYSPFVVVGGYCLFHDTALPTDKTEQGQWPQNHSYAGQPDSTLGVREGLKKLGLLQGHRTDWKFIEEIPSNSGLMGMILFQKTKEL